MNYWYAARPDEIFLDLDSRRALMRCMKVLRAAKMELLGSKVRAVFHYPTGRKGHCHVVIVLRNSISDKARAIVALWLGSDRLRTCYVMARIWSMEHDRYEVVAPDLLIASREYHRVPDGRCECKGKHKERHITDNCPALLDFLGTARSKDFFPRAGKQKLQPLRIPIGAVPLSLIRRWKRG